MGAGNIRGENRAKVLQALIDRAMDIAKWDTLTPDGLTAPHVQELAELVYSIWTAKNRRGFLNFRIKRNLYHDALLRAGASCWRHYIQTTILGFKDDDEES